VPYLSVSVLRRYTKCHYLYLYRYNTGTFWRCRHQNVSTEYRRWQTATTSVRRHDESLMSTMRHRGLTPTTTSGRLQTRLPLTADRLISRFRRRRRRRRRSWEFTVPTCDGRTKLKSWYDQAVARPATGDSNAIWLFCSVLFFNPPRWLEVRLHSWTTFPNCEWSSAVLTAFINCPWLDVVLQSCAIWLSIIN